MFYSRSWTPVRNSVLIPSKSHSHIQVILTVEAMLKIAFEQRYKKNTTYYNELEFSLWVKKNLEMGYKIRFKNTTKYLS